MLKMSRFSPYYHSNVCVYLVGDGDEIDEIELLDELDDGIEVLVLVGQQEDVVTILI